MSKEIAHGDEFEGLVEITDDGDLKKIFIRESNQTRIFSNDFIDRVVLKIDSGKNVVFEVKTNFFTRQFFDTFSHI